MKKVYIVKFVTTMPSGERYESVTNAVFDSQKLAQSYCDWQNNIEPEMNFYWYEEPVINEEMKWW